MKEIRSVLLAFAVAAGLPCFAQTKVNFDSLVAPGYQYKVYDYPPAPTVLPSYTIMHPGVVLVAMPRGVVIAGLNVWAYQQKSGDLIGAEYCYADSSLFILSTVEQKTVLEKLKKNQGKTQRKTMLKLPSGYYFVKTYRDGTFYLYGKADDEKLYNIWQYANNEMNLLFSGNEPIRDLDIISSDIVMFCTGKDLHLAQMDKGIANILHLQLEIDGAVVTSEGQYFVSTAVGVILLPDLKDASKLKVIATGVHGPLRLYNNNLYILWRENNQILEIKLQ